MRGNVTEARRRRVLFNEIDRSLRVLDVFLDPQSQAVLPIGWEKSPLWRNPLGFDSIGRVMDHRPIDCVHRIAPRALGLICASQDSSASPDSLRQLFAAAAEPKRWIEVDGAGHYDLYQGLFARFRTEIVKFFDEFMGDSHNHGQLQRMLASNSQ
jgi:hypothetical protein